MIFPRAGMRRTAAHVLLAAAAGLSGCSSSSSSLAQVTGSQGGMLPGMTLPKPSQSKTATAPGFSGVVPQVLPNGRIVANEYLNGQLLSQTWFSSLRLPEKAIYYINGTMIGGVAEFGPDGKMTRRTYYFLGSEQPERVEDYAGGTQIVRFTTFWQNGNKRIYSEANVVPTTGLNNPADAGLVNRAQEWYANGRPKLLSQIHIERDARGQPTYQEKQGRQTTWDEDGYRTSDMEYDHDRWIYDYLAQKKNGGQ